MKRGDAMHRAPSLRDNPALRAAIHRELRNWGIWAHPSWIDREFSYKGPITSSLYRAPIAGDVPWRVDPDEEQALRTDGWVRDVGRIDRQAADVLTLYYAHGDERGWLLPLQDVAGRLHLGNAEAECLLWAGKQIYHEIRARWLNPTFEDMYPRGRACE